ncbi:retrotransposon protein, putative, ty1-copia subclass, partial [Tanacetum coccineum]
MYYQWDKLNTLEQPLPSAPVAPAGQHVAPEILAAHTAWEEWQSVARMFKNEGSILNHLEAFGAPRDPWPCSGKVQKGKKHNKPQPQKAARGQNQGNGKNKHAYAPKPKIPPPPKREDPAKDSIYHEYGETGHWKRNCPQDGIFEIDLSNSYANKSSIYTVSNKRAKLDLDSALLWHCRLGHISKKRIEKLQHDGLLNSTDLRAFEKCIPCMSGKMARKPYTHQVERAKDLLGLIHTDVCGPFKITSRQGASYFVTFTDDFSRYGYVYLLKHKHEVFETFKVFQKEVENQLSKTIKSLCSDRGGEYMSQEFLDHLKDHGIIAHRTPPYTPQHNGSFCDYALETAARILNMVPTKKVEKTPYEVWHGQAPKLSYLKVWGCEALVKRDTLTKPDKLEPSLINQEASGSQEDLKIIQEEDTHPTIDTSLNHEEDNLEMDEPQSDIIPIRRSTRTRRPTDRMCLYIDAEEHELGDLDELEMKSMKDNEVWVLVKLPPSGKTVGSKWLFKKKTNMDGAIHTNKARLVAKGYTQTPGIDYEETFSPIADIRAIRILIAIAAYYDYEICQNADEPCVYLKASGSNVTFLILYVDDILIMGNSIPMLQDVKSYLGK